MENTSGKIRIRIKTIQLSDGEKSELINEYDGKLFIKGEAVHIFYNEGDEDNTACSVRAKHGDVQIVRKGDAVSSKLCFSRGTVYKTAYHTAYGKMALVIKPSLVLCAVDSQGGKIRLEYDMSLEGQEFFNDVTMYIDPA